jgi:hypothetical protein
MENYEHEIYDIPKKVRKPIWPLMFLMTYLFFGIFHTSMSASLLGGTYVSLYTLSLCVTAFLTVLLCLNVKTKLLSVPFALFVAIEIAGIIRDCIILTKEAPLVKDRIEVYITLVTIYGISILAQMVALVCYGSVFFSSTMLYTDRYKAHKKTINIVFYVFLGLNFVFLAVGILASVIIMLAYLAGDIETFLEYFVTYNIINSIKMTVEVMSEESKGLIVKESFAIAKMLVMLFSYTGLFFTKRWIDRPYKRVIE